MQRPSYEQFPIWQRYQSFFPPVLRCTADSTPQEEWWQWRGLDVHLDRLGAPAPRLKVIVLHGVGSYGRVMAPAAVLAQRYGYQTVAPDLPGYGLTRVPAQRLDYGLWIECVCDLIDAELARDGLPVVLFGMSLGGMLAYHAAARSRRVVGLVASTLADCREPAVRQGFARNRLLGGPGLWLIDRLSAVTDSMPLPIAWVSKMDGISNLPELAALCRSDRMGGGNRVPARFLRTFVDARPALEPEQFDVCPVLLAHPGVDRMTDIEHSRRFFDRLACPKQMVVLEGASHMPTEQPGVDQLQAAVLGFLRSL